VASTAASTVTDPASAPTAIHDLIAGDAQALSAKLQSHRQRLFPPKARKHLRRFSSGEAARLIGVDDGYLRRLSLDGKGPTPEVGPSGRRSYSSEDIQALRVVLDESAKTGRRYQKDRRTDEHLQVIAAVNFKGGSDQERRQRQHISRNTWLYRATVCLPWISIRKQACLPCTAFSQSSTSVITRLSTRQSDTTKRVVHWPR
jgi:hypothetical protein